MTVARTVCVGALAMACLLAPSCSTSSSTTMSSDQPDESSTTTVGESTPDASATIEPEKEESGAESVEPASMLVTGTVVAGPQGPPTPEDESGGVAPLEGARLSVRDSSGAEVASVISGVDGSFSFSVPPGGYEIVPEPVDGMARTAEPQSFDVPLNQPLTLHYDTGVR